MSSLIVNLVNDLEVDIENDDESDIWGDPGTRSVDVAIETIADLYLERPALREEIRTEIERVPNTWALVLYIRRASLLVKNKSDEHPIRRGLVVAAMLNGRSDYRDLIVSLVILRAAAEKAGIDTRKFFDAAIDGSTAKIHASLRNARDHSQSDIQSTFAEFGPKE